MLKELVDKSRSHREFAPGVTVPRERVEAWILNASHCPSAMNLQAVKYKIIDGKDAVADFLPLTRWGSAIKDKKFPPDGHGPSLFIVMCHDTDITPLKPLFMIDVGICAQTIMLSAAEDGFGGCIIGSASSETVKDALSLSDNLEPVLVLGLGLTEDTVVMTELTDGTKYWRDGNNIHYVPKRSLEEIIIK